MNSHQKFQKTITLRPRCPLEKVSLFSQTLPYSTSSFEEYPGLAERKNEVQKTDRKRALSMSLLPSTSSSYEDYAVDVLYRERALSVSSLSLWKTPVFPLEIENILIQLKTPSVLSEVKLFDVHTSAEFDEIKSVVEAKMRGGQARELITIDLKYKGLEAAALFRLLHQYLFCLIEPLLIPNGNQNLVWEIVNYKGEKSKD